MKAKIDSLIEIAKQIGRVESHGGCVKTLLGDLGRLRDELVEATRYKREVTQERAREVVGMFADQCNISQWSKKEVRAAVVAAYTGTHRHLQNEMMTVIALLIDEVGRLDADTYCDARNVWAYAWAQKVRKVGW